ncbi:hypothetical protein emb_1c0353 [Coriobacteriaceae bacterium EMTCatB1]|nr:hypothetical protein emb_1c0353 [Coriobacteriaceae bacterium EMTCatB1]
MAHGHRQDFVPDLGEDRHHRGGAVVRGVRRRTGGYRSWWLAELLWEQRRDGRVAVVDRGQAPAGDRRASGGAEGGSRECGHPHAAWSCILRLRCGVDERGSGGRRTAALECGDHVLR